MPVIKPLSRHAVIFQRPDGKRVVRVSSAQNPWFYKDDKGRLSACDPASVEDVPAGFSKAGPVLFRGKGPVHVGIRKDGNSQKFLGFRPDYLSSGGSEQLEFSLDRFEVAGKPLNLDLASRSVVSPQAVSLGGLVVASGRRGTRQLFRVTGRDGFLIRETINAKGLDLVRRDDLGEFWFVSAKTGEFRFRIVRPGLFDAASLAPLTDENGLPLAAVDHSLTEDGPHAFIYEKTPASGFGALALPESFYVDADVVYSAAGDGYILNSSALGLSVNTAAASYASAFSYSFYVYLSVVRSFFAFDLSGLSGSVLAASFNLTSAGASSPGTVHAFQGGQADPLTVDDWGAFFGSPFGSVAFPASGLAEIELDLAACNYIEGALGGTAKLACLCGRDYTGSGPDEIQGCFFSDAAGTASDPYLELDLAAPGGQKIVIVT